MTPLLLRSLMAVLLLSMSASVAAEPPTLGWLEWTRLLPQNVRVKAKLDTGARTSAIDATDIVTFEVDGELHVRFRVPVRERPEDFDHADDLVIERPVVREVVIKEHRSRNTRRYVVELEICLGGEHFSTQVSLSDRSRFNYPLLLGRRALSGRALVDSAQTFINDAPCGNRLRESGRAEPEGGP